MRRAIQWCALLILAPSLGAQETPPPAEPVLASLAPARPVVRLRADQARVTGRLLAAGGGRAALGIGADTQVVWLRAVDSVWTRGRAWKTGAIVGGAVGMALLGAFTSVIVSGLCEVDCDNAGLEGAVVGGLVGLGGGALLGAAVGAAIPKWKRRFP